MSDYRSHNRRIFEKGLRQFATQQVGTTLLDVCKSVARELVGYIEGSFVFPNGDICYPVDTGNLHDATGIGVYYNGMLSSFLPTKKATEPQSYKWEYPIIGSEFLRSALEKATSQFSKGLWIVLFSTVPYALEVEQSGSPAKRGIGFFGDLSDELVSAFMRARRKIKV